jgi:hypothetical protein
MSNGKSSGAFGFALNFLWLLSLFQDKESDRARAVENQTKIIKS